MQDLEEQRLQQFWILTHRLKVETLEAGEGNSVARIVEKKTELSAACPLRETRGKVVRQGVHKYAEGPQSWLDFIKVCDLLVEVAFGRWRKFLCAARLQ